jgi:putative flippase GtrA
MNEIIFWFEKQVLLSTRLLKYFIVGCAGIAVNLATMALLLAGASRQAWMPPAIANIVSTLGNFFFHNLWTFSDRRHQGSRVVRGFLSFAFISAVAICVTTAAYVGFTKIASHLPITISHPGALGIPLACQMVAITLGASISYVLNREYTWPRTEATASADLAKLPGTDGREILSLDTDITPV